MFSSVSDRTLPLPRLCKTLVGDGTKGSVGVALPSPGGVEASKLFSSAADSLVGFGTVSSDAGGTTGRTGSVCGVIVPLEGVTGSSSFKLFSSAKSLT